MSPGSATSEASDRLEGLPASWPWAFFGSLFAAVFALTWRYELDPGARGADGRPFSWNDAERDTLLLGLAGAVALGLLVVWLLKKSGRSWPAGRRIALVLLMALTWSAGLVYFYGAHGARQAYSHLHDSYHYVLGPKYFAELGYDQLYVCTAQVARNRDISDEAPARDLRTDRTVTVGELRAAPSCRERFSEERWRSFEHDVGLFLETDRAVVRRALRDRGYNGTPLHTFLAATLLNAVPLDYATLSLLTLLDVLGLCVMLAALCHAFGWQLGLLCSLLFFSQFVDRHLIIGGSCLRYQWLVALGLGLAWLKRERHASAGAALAVAAALNVFPVLFMAGIVLQSALSLVRTRSLPAPRRRFFAGALAAGALSLVLGAAHAGGLDNYGGFAHAMKVHDAAGRVPGFGVGLKYNFVPSRPESGISDATRMRALKRRMPAIVVCAALLLLATGFLLTRLDDVEGAVLAGFVGLFCIFGPTGYYFAFAALLVLCWHRRAYDSGGLLMLMLLFVAQLPPYLSVLSGDIRYHAFNRWMSASWTVYTVLMLGYLGWCTFPELFRRMEARPS